MFFFRLQTKFVSLNVCSLFQYDNELRKLILGYKLKSDPFLLIRSVLERELTADLFDSCGSLVLASPSSLKSKILGRRDLAFALAVWISRTTSLSLQLPPWSTQFSLAKQTTRRTKKVSPVEITKKSSLVWLESDHLFCDDVVTTGGTLIQLATDLNIKQANCFTLAYSPKLLKN